MGKLAKSHIIEKPVGHEIVLRPSLEAAIHHTSQTFIYICKILFIYLFIFGCAGSSLLQGLSLVAVRGLLIAGASLVAEHGL